MSTIGSNQNTIHFDRPLLFLGGTPAQLALTLLGLLSEKRNVGLVLSESTAESENLQSELLSLLAARAALPDNTGTRKITIELFPEWEHPPFSSVLPSIKVRTQRTRVLTQLATLEPQNFFLVIATPLALFQTTVPRLTFEKHRFAFQANAPAEALTKATRESATERLRLLGYQPTETVEDVGTFAFRGDILDIYSPDKNQPLRIEFFDDTVEKIRPFNAKTQRTEKNLTVDRLNVYPCREFLILPETQAELRASIKSHADECGISRKLRDPVLEQLALGICPPYSEFWWPFLLSQSTAFEFFPIDTLTIALQPLAIQSQLAKNLGTLEKAEKNLEPKIKIVPALSNLYPGIFEKTLKLVNDAPVQFSAIHTEGRQTVTLPSEDYPEENNLNQWLAFIKQKLDEKVTVVLCARNHHQQELLKHLGQEVLNRSGLFWALSNITGCAKDDQAQILFVPISVFLERSKNRNKAKAPLYVDANQASTVSPFETLSDLNTGDLVVHIDHGIGRFSSIQRLTIAGGESDFVQLIYAGNDKLYVPVYRLDLIQRYSIGGADSLLDKLGSPHFIKKKEQVRESVKSLAINLLELYAKRQFERGIAFSPRDQTVDEFEAQFPYEETPDQASAIESVFRDLSSGRIMDRLICGDVGFGKTEVAMRAAFRVASEGRQVAVLVPTTILAHQHEKNFKQRFEGFPITVASLSRFKSQKQQKTTLEEMATGKTDIVIGTHRLLSKDVKFRALGILIVDEEHRFGVEHKERIKALKENTHVLTLTATPIPRTLHMAMTGIRDISLITTPPVERLSIKTYIAAYSDEIIRTAIERELGRGGQVFYLYNRVQDIHKVSERLRRFFPEAKIAIGHGQMPESELEGVMSKFYAREIQILICTTIIESGLDLPSANTMIVERADWFGLAQLYQIRGRVGRGQERAHAYFLLPESGNTTPDALERLEVMQRFAELGSGFSVASHDLEMRGGGDLLGPQQSGQIAAVGFELYLELLDEAVKRLKRQRANQTDSHSDSEPIRAPEPEIRVKQSAFFPDEYISDLHHRLAFYRKLSSAQNEERLLAIEDELKDRYGNLPEPVINLTWVIRLKILAREFHLSLISVGDRKVTVQPSEHSPIKTEVVLARVAAKKPGFQLTGDSRIVFSLETSTLSQIFFTLKKFLEELR